MGTLVGAIITVIIQIVALLHGTGVDVTVALVTVEVTPWAGALTVSVHIHIHALACTHGDTGTVTPLAVIVHPVATDFGPTSVYSRVVVIAVGAQTASTCAIAILVSILAVRREHEVSSIAILVDSIPWNISSTGVDGIISVVTI